MYWSRTGSFFELLLWLILCGMWWVGGWLLVTHTFRLRSRERLFGGMALGWLLFIVLSNLLTRLLALTPAFWAAAALVLITGLLAAWRSTSSPNIPLGSPAWFRALFPIGDLKHWPLLLLFGSMLGLFILINRGLAIFDDYFNLPIVSRLAAGDIPLHFYLNPEIPLDYHYGLNLFAANLVRIGGFFPWSAFDFSKSLSLALTVVLAYCWFRRYTKRQGLLFLGILLVLFASGTRWLLLLLPPETLQQLGSQLNLLGSAAQTAPDLHAILISQWNIDGAGPIPFPMAFANGVFVPGILQIAGPGAMPVLAVFLLLLLKKTHWSAFSSMLYGLVLASLALSAEYMFLMIWAGFLLTALLAFLFKDSAARRRSAADFWPWAWILALSAVLAVTAGGVLTDTAARLLNQLLGRQTVQGISFVGLQLRWFPAITSAHLGALSLLNPQQLVIALLEMGPVLLWAPWVIRRGWQNTRRSRLIIGGLSLAALVGFVLPLFLDLAFDERDIARFTGSALWLWMILGAPQAASAWLHSGQWRRFLVGAGYILIISSGIALFPSMLTAVATPQLSYNIEEMDAMFCKSFWDRLEPDSHVLDPAIPFRPSVLFARTTGPAYKDLYNALPEFLELLQSADPRKIAGAGYTYIYLNKGTWQKMTQEEKDRFQSPCVKTVAEERDGTGDFRRLLDVRACDKTGP